MSMTSNPGARLTDSARHLVEEADRFLKEAAESGDAKLDAVRGKLAQQVRQTRAQLAEWEADAVHQVRRTARGVDLRVHEHPYAAIGIAAAVGVLVGLLTVRR